MRLCKSARPDLLGGLVNRSACRALPGVRRVNLSSYGGIDEGDVVRGLRSDAWYERDGRCRGGDAEG